MASTVTERAKEALEKAREEPAARIGVGAALAGAAIAAGAVAKRISDRSDSGPSRAYRLRKDEAPADGIPRIAYGRADDALEQLRDRPDGIEAAVHTARKDMKKLRSLLRLVRGEIGTDTYRRENERYRHAGRLLSGARDAEVKLQTLAALRGGDDGLDGSIEAYAAALSATRDEVAEPDSVLERAASEIEAGRDAIERWDLPGDGWDPATSGGLERAYRRGRRALGRVRADPSDEAVHEWRKRSKDLWYHLRILRPAWPALMKPLADEAHELSDLLGDHHDLAVLAEDARGRPGCFAAETDLDALLAAVRGRQGELLATAIPLGVRLYAEKPKRFRARLSVYWRVDRT